MQRLTRGVIDFEDGLVDHRRLTEAVLVASGAPACASLETAAVLYGLPVWGYGLEPIPVMITVPRHRRMSQVDGRVVNRCEMSPRELAVVAGLSVTSPVRTVEDLCRRRLGRSAIVTADAAAARWPDLRAELLTRAERRRPGSVALRLVLDRLEPRSGSPLESVWRWELVAAGLPAPEVQFLVRHGGVVLARADLCWPKARLILEVDGRGPHSDPATFTRDRQRQNDLILAGWTVLRVTAADLRRVAEVVAQLWIALGPAAKARTAA